MSHAIDKSTHECIRFCSDRMTIFFRIFGNDLLNIFYYSLVILVTIKSEIEVNQKGLHFYYYIYKKTLEKFLDFYIHFRALILLYKC